MSGKNSADIRMVVDALDLCYSKQHIDMFALLSGDSDFSPLVSKLKENDKRVIGCGVQARRPTCSRQLRRVHLLRRSDPRAEADAAKATQASDGKKQEAVDRVVEIVASLESDYDPLWGSMVKQSVRRVYPGFNESYYGYRSFSDLLEDAAKQGLIELEFDAAARQLQGALRVTSSISGGCAGAVQAALAGAPSSKLTAGCDRTREPTRQFRAIRAEVQSARSVEREPPLARPEAHELEPFHVALELKRTFTQHRG